MRLKFLGLLCLFLLLTSPQSEAATAQNRKRPTGRVQTQTPIRRDIATVKGFAPNPLVLIISVTEARRILLNTEDEGTLDDLSQLRALLERIFEQRTQNGTIRPGADEIEKTVIIKTSASLKQDEIARLVGEVKAAGASPVRVMTEAEYKAEFEEREPPPPPRPPTAEEKERIRRMGPISGGVLNGKAISLPKPVYPPRVLMMSIKGMVTVKIVVDESGNVMSARAVAGHPLLRASAVQAARLARFSPTQLSGQPVKVKGVLVYNFDTSQSASEQR